MDPNAGRFLEEDDERVEAWMQRIEVGEVIKIKGEEMVVAEIRERELVLRLTSREERLAKERDAMSSLLDQRESFLDSLRKDEQKRQRERRG